MICCGDPLIRCPQLEMQFKWIAPRCKNQVLSNETNRINTLAFAKTHRCRVKRDGKRLIPTRARGQIGDQAHVSTTSLPMSTQGKCPCIVPPRVWTHMRTTPLLHSHTETMRSSPPCPRVRARRFKSTRILFPVDW